MEATTAAIPRSRRLRPVSHPGAWAALAPGLTAFAAFFVAPAAIFVLYSFLTPGAFSAHEPLTIESYRSALQSSIVRQAALNSLRVGLPVAIVTLGLAVPVAYWLRYSAGRLFTPVLFAIVATMFASYLVRIYAWRSVLGDQGLVNSGLESLGVLGSPIHVLFTPVATTIGLVALLLPIAVLIMLGAFQPLQAGYLEAGRDLGASGVRLWQKVILPAIFQPLATTFVLIFVIASADWVTPLLLGGGRNPMVGELIQADFKTNGNYPQGAALSVLALIGYGLIFVTVAGFLRWRRLGDLRWIDAVPGERKPAPLAGVVCGAVLVFLFVPLLVVILFSFHASPSLSFPFSGFSTRWYSQLFADPVAMSALRTSAIVAAIVATTTIALGLPTALGLARIGQRARGGLRAMVLLPIALPPLFIGAALLSYFLRIGVELSLVTVIIGHVVQTFPLFVLIVGSTLERLDPGLDEAATDLGASSVQAFFRVTLPQIWPSVFGAAAVSFALSFDEFPVTVFTIGQQTTLPLYIYGRLRQTIDPLVNAVSTLLLASMLMIFVIAACGAWWRRRRARPLPTNLEVTQ